MCLNYCTLADGPSLSFRPLHQGAVRLMTVFYLIVSWKRHFIDVIKGLSVSFENTFSLLDPLHLLLLVISLATVANLVRNISASIDDKSYHTEKF